VRRTLSVVALLTAPLVALPLAALPSAQAAVVDPLTGPDYETPFPCGAVWTGTTRSSHRPSTSSIDFNRTGDLGDLTVASAPGVVSRVADTGRTSYGRYLILDHGDGSSTLYAHLQVVWAVPGQRVDHGTVLGLVGESGGVTAAHLHFEERLDGRVHAPYFDRARYMFGSTTASTNCADVPLSGDWDGNGHDDVAVFRPVPRGGVFRLHSPAGVAAVPIGGEGAVPVTGDWDGDGDDEVGVRRPGRRLFELLHDDGTRTSLRLGGFLTVPVTGDWDGDGTTEVGVWRPASSTFRLLVDPGVSSFVKLGQVGSVPVTGDWDGDGITDVGVYDAPTATFTLRTADADGVVTLQTVGYGASTDLPVTGDWDGDGVTEVGLWRPGTARFFKPQGQVTKRLARPVHTQRFGIPR